MWKISVSKHRVQLVPRHSKAGYCWGLCKMAIGNSKKKKNQITEFCLFLLSDGEIWARERRKERKTNTPPGSPWVHIWAKPLDLLITTNPATVSVCTRGSRVLTVLHRAGLENWDMIFGFRLSYFVAGEGGPSPTLTACCTLTHLPVGECFSLLFPSCPWSDPTSLPAKPLPSPSASLRVQGHVQSKPPSSLMPSFSNSLPTVFRRPLLTASQIHSPLCRQSFLSNVISDFSLFSRSNPNPLVGLTEALLGQSSSCGWCPCCRSASHSGIRSFSQMSHSLLLQNLQQALLSAREASVSLSLYLASVINL